MRTFVLGTLLIALGAAPAGAQSGPSQCSALKTKALGVYTQRLAACRAKALKKGEDVDGVCVAKAVSALEKTFEKAEKKDDCLENGDASFALGEVDQCLERAGTVIEGEAVCCTMPSFACLYVTSPQDCTGTVGLPGTACDANGLCAGAPSAGGCCELPPTAFGTGCTTNVGEGGCTGAGGTWFPNALCEAPGSCAAVP